jgi:nucleoside-diphosphate-sugar epimerase
MVPRSVFVTGATGHAGRAVVRALIDADMDVTALVRKPTTLEHCRTVVAQLSTIRSVAQDVSRADAIVHLASPRQFDERTALEEDILGTANLLDAWRRAGPFVYASSPTVQQWSPSTIDANSPIQLSNWYDVQKFTNELQVRVAADQSGAPGIVLRPGFFFGTTGVDDGRQFLSQVYQQCRLGGRFVCECQDAIDFYGASFIGPADFGRAVVATLSMQVSGTFNVATGFCTWRELIDTVNRHAGTDAGFNVRPHARPEAGELRLFQSRTCLDTSAFDRQTGFAGTQSLDELVAAFVSAARMTLSEAS